MHRQRRPPAQAERALAANPSPEASTAAGDLSGNTRFALRTLNQSRSGAGAGQETGNYHSRGRTLVLRTRLKIVGQGFSFDFEHDADNREADRLRSDVGTLRSE